jgi:GxxExxY protein
MEISDADWQRECAERHQLNGLAEQVIGAAYEVANTLGPGFLERVYERALLNELRLRGVPVEPQVPIPVSDKGEQVGEYFADLVVDGALIVEVKCVDEFCREHTAQCLNYLRATGYRIALLINFQQPRVVWKRVVHNF